MLTYDELVTRSRTLVDRYKELLSAFDNLETFVDAIQWDSDALSLIELFKETINDILEIKKSEKQVLDKMKEEREAKSFFARNFSTRNLSG
jgi:hypothetical protein